MPVATLETSSILSQCPWADRTAGHEAPHLPTERGKHGAGPAEYRRERGAVEAQSSSAAVLRRLDWGRGSTRIGFHKGSP